MARRGYLLPLAYVDNVADAIVLAAAQRSGARPRLYHRRRARAAGRLRAAVSPGSATGAGCRCYVPLGAAARRCERGRARRRPARPSRADHPPSGGAHVAQCDVHHPPRAARSSAGSRACRSTRRCAAALRPARRGEHRGRCAASLAGMSAVTAGPATRRAYRRVAPAPPQRSMTTGSVRRSLERWRARRLAHRPLSPDPRHGPRPFRLGMALYEHKPIEAELARLDVPVHQVPRRRLPKQHALLELRDAIARRAALSAVRAGLGAGRQAARLAAEELPAALALARVIRRARPTSSTSATACAPTSTASWPGC